MGKVNAELLLTKSCKTGTRNHSQKLLDRSKQIQQKFTTQRTGNLLNFLPQNTAEKESISSFKRNQTDGLHIYKMILKDRVRDAAFNNP